MIVPTGDAMALPPKERIVVMFSSQEPKRGDGMMGRVQVKVFELLVAIADSTAPPWRVKLQTNPVSAIRKGYIC